MSFFYYRYLAHYLFSVENYDLPRVTEEEALSQATQLFFLKKQSPLTAKASFALTHSNQLFQDETIGWLNTHLLVTDPAPILDKRLLALLRGRRITVINTAYPDYLERVKMPSADKNAKKRLHLLALGDVGSHVLLGLKLLGGDCIASIGIFDLNPQLCQRFLLEMNQISYAGDYDALPPVDIVSLNQLFDCDLFIFCAAQGVPPVTQTATDVRMAQLDANATIIKHYATLARQANFQGQFAVISDPVDPLCRIAFLSSNQDTSGHLDFKGLRPEQIQGYGLGVMNSRAAQVAQEEPRFARFLTEGRVYGPHGQDLVVAESILDYDDALSQALTAKTREANLQIRALGYKPFIAPAIASGVIPLLQTLRGQWHYSANFLAGVYMGARNRATAAGLEIEVLPLAQPLYQRICHAYEELDQI